MAGKTYRIGEAADILQLKSYVLRFWETEFTQLAPLRTDKGQRLYTEEHLELLRRIRHLLHEQGMTIDGARRVLMAELKHASAAGSTSARVTAPEGAATGVEPFVPSTSVRTVSTEPVPASSSVDAEALRLVRDELLELRNLLLSQ